MKIITEHHSDNPHRRELIRHLVAANNANGPLEHSAYVGFYAVNDEGQLIGGVQGHFEWDWLHITHLWVKEPGKGLGRQLMDRAEIHAKDKGKTGILLDTLGFQARPFYEKCGFEIMGTIANAAGPHARYFMIKRLG